MWVPGEPWPARLHKEPLQSKDWFPNRSSRVGLRGGESRALQHLWPRPRPPPLLSATQIRSPMHLPSRPASEEGLSASSALPAAVHPGTRHVCGERRAPGKGAGNNSSALFLMELIISVIAHQREKKGCRTPGSCCPCDLLPDSSLACHWLLPAP